MRNGDGSTYNNTCGSIGLGMNLALNDKSAIFMESEAGCGTAIKGSVELGYKRALKNNSNLVFSANASIDSSLTKTETYSAYINNTAMVNGNMHQLDYVDFKDEWNPGNFKLSGKIGFNKNTKWGGYEVGAEAGYRNSCSPSFYKNGGTDITYDLNNGKKEEVHTSWEYGRSSTKGAFVSPYATAKINLTKNGALQAIAKGDIHKAEIGIRFTLKD